MNEITTTSVQEDTTSQTVVQTVLQTEPLSQEPTEPQIVEASSTLPEMRDNDLHQLFYTLGVDLDYVPSDPYECFTFGAQLVTALFFLVFFLIYLFKLISTFCGGH